jgi:protease-4
MNQTPNDPSHPPHPPHPPSDPIDPQRAVGPPPPPPPAAYPPDWGQPRSRASVFGSLKKVFAALSIALVLIAVGYYGALFTLLNGGGRVDVTTYQDGKGDQRVAIIPVVGLIDANAADFVHQAVETVIDDKTVKAVVLYVDSPGGMIGPSEQIYHELERLKQRRNVPVIASFGGYAASGGYYIACASDYIYAQPACVTGSIGVIAQGVSLHGFLTEKLNMTPIVVTAEGSPDKQVGNSPIKKWDEADNQAIRELLTAMHERFRAVVEAARSDAMSAEQLAAATTGQAYTTNDALAIKLIDEVGYLDDAIARARADGEIEAEKPPVLKYHPRRGLLDAMLGARSQGPTGLGAPLDAEQVRRLVLELSTPRAMYWYQP